MSIGLTDWSIIFRSGKYYKSKKNKLLNSWKKENQFIKIPKTPKRKENYKNPNQNLVSYTLRDILVSGLFPKNQVSIMQTAKDLCKEEDFIFKANSKIRFLTRGDSTDNSQRYQNMANFMDLIYRALAARWKIMVILLLNILNNKRSLSQNHLYGII